MPDTLRLDLRVSPEWLDALDSARGVTPRATFVKAAVMTAVEQAPGGSTPPSVPQGDGAARSPAPARRPTPKSEQRRQQVLNDTATELPKIGRKPDWKQ